MITHLIGGFGIKIQKTIQIKKNVEILASFGAFGEQRGSSEYIAGIDGAAELLPDQGSIRSYKSKCSP